MACLPVNVVSEAYVVILVGECHNPLCVNLRHRKQMAQHRADAVPQLRAEVIEDQVRECFTNRIYLVL